LRGDRGLESNQRQEHGSSSKQELGSIQKLELGSRQKQAFLLLPTHAQSTHIQELEIGSSQKWLGA
jgi:hypothetical protein